ncbi:short-chain dehydrogenase [Exophiala viscosa]|uniref:Short-chain dehydrogenase n=1 Tax=Exophiala viscosa TaxID=2486360 RepID=A0AAN6E4X0_9EURO|nr:short-chain dehydrogenase [Exophiala viscosa]KAI1629335.1 short-chain dehydrogenase [Exophiala viscosa]
MFHQARAFWNQSFSIPHPPLTEKNLPDQNGKVYLITGANTGVGYQLATILYSRNAKVYIGARSEAKALAAIDNLKQLHPKSEGSLEYLHLDLSDLTTIKATAEEFMSRETKLHWLNNNAGVMVPPEGSKGAQGIDLQFQTNILGPFLLTKLLLPILRRTAEAEPQGTVRVSWAGSLTVDVQTVKGGLAWKMDKDGQDTLDDSKGNRLNYGATKAANYFLAHEFGKRFGSRDGVLHTSYNPGNLKSDLQRHTESQWPAFARWILHHWLLYPAIFGAYTELYSGLSPDLTIKEQGVYIVPWGRRASVRPDLVAELGKEGGSPERLFEWCDRVTKQYA